MKKIFSLLILLILFIFSTSAFADIIPSSTKSIKYYGIGTLNMPKSYTVYKYPDAESDVIREVNYDDLKKSAIVNSIDMKLFSYQ